MSLNWEWKDKMGEVTDSRGCTCNLYRGNAFMIAVCEWTNEKGVDQYSLAWFFSDETHMKRCLGLAKGYDGIDFDWASFRLDTRYKENEKFVSALVKAGLSVTIRLYNGGETDGK